MEPNNVKSEEITVIVSPSEINDVLDAGIELENDFTGEISHGNMGFPVYTYSFSLPTDKYDTIIGNQADILSLLGASNYDFEASEEQSNIYLELQQQNEQLATTVQLLAEENAMLTEMNQYTAYIFVLVLAFVVYRIIGGALSAMFGGG